MILLHRNPFVYLVGLPWDIRKKLSRCIVHQCRKRFLILIGDLTTSNKFTLSANPSRELDAISTNLRGDQNEEGARTDNIFQGLVGDLIENLGLYKV